MTPETALITSGMLFVRGWPTVSTARDGSFQLRVPCCAHYPDGTRTRWTVLHQGESARAFHVQHKQALRPGQPLRVVLHRETVHSGEILALVQSITLAPLAAHVVRDEQAA